VPADAPDLFRLINDFEVAKQLARVPFPYPQDAADEWIARAEKCLGDGSAIQLAIAGRDDPVLLGGIGLEIDRSAREAELGYWVARRYWGHGVAAEAAARIASWALANLDIDRLVARAALDNAASQRVLEKAGFVATGEGEGFSMARGETRRVRLFEATRAPARVAPPEAQAAPRMLLVAAVALIESDTRVLLARRPEGKALSYRMRAGVRTKVWDNHAFRALPVTHFVMILPIDVPTIPAADVARVEALAPPVALATNAQVAELMDDMLVFQSDTRHTMFGLVLVMGIVALAALALGIGVYFR
jgi:RimJ/RimL family protein N-acetyltransferase